MRSSGFFGTFLKPFSTLTLLVSAPGALSGCGAQINTLRKTTSTVSGASGVPPLITSFAVSDSSPTNHSPLSLQWGVVVGSVTQYCILENTHDSSLCVWRSAPLPTTYTDFGTDGSLTLTAYLKNEYGTSTQADAAPILIDRTAPELASAVVGNSSPTNSTSFSLSYGAITHTPYTQYCILENLSSPTTCSWISGSVPSTFTVSSVSGAKILSIWLRDPAGNLSNRVQTPSVTYDGSVPTVAITAPAAGSYINAANVASFAVSGTCSENGRTVTLSGSASGSATCTGGAWSVNLNFTSAASGTVSVYADLSNAAGTSAVQASRSFMKDVSAPTLAISSPAAGSYVNLANLASFPVSGTCSENGQNVVISGDASATVPCTAGAWSTNLNFTSAPAGSVSITLNHSDAAGNAATPVVRSFTKDVTAPTLAITSPASGSTINLGNVSSFAVGGTCSENGQNVVITGAATGSVACASGTWSLNLNFSSAADGLVTIYANHADQAGNPAPQASISFTKSTGVPAVAITNPAANSYINAADVSSFAVSGTCSENGQNVVISGDASATVACSSGTWSTNLNFTSAASGSVTIYADHENSGGNPAPQASRSFMKDVTAPSVAISSPIAGSYINTSNETSFSVSGTCSENGQNVLISGDASATVACSAGTWSANLNFAAASDGTVSITLNHSDAAGNAAPPATRNFTKDTSAPSVAITSPLAGSYANLANASAFPVSGTCSANGQNVLISGAGSATVACSGGTWSTSVDVSAAADGAFTLYADHTNAAGNPATQASRNFNKDTAPPTVAITLPLASAYMNAANMAAFAVSGTCSENGQNVIISGAVSGSTVCASGTWSINLDLSGSAQGNVTVQADLTDAAGNPATQSSRTWVKDSVGPTMTVTSPNGGESWAGSSTKNITWTSSDTSGIAANSILIEYTTNGSTWTTIASGEADDGTYTWAVPAGINSTTVKVRVTGTDLAGNTGNDTSDANLTIDSTPPTITSISIMNNTTPTPSRWYLIKYTGLSDTVISAYCINVNDTNVAHCSWVNATSVPYAYQVPSTPGSYALTVWLKDPAGNQQVTGTTATALSWANTLAITPTSSTISSGLSWDYPAGSYHYGDSVVTLNDGRILLAGGCLTGTNQIYHTYTQIYDAVADTWTPAGHMHEARCYAASTLLADGRVLMIGGATSDTASTASAEIYDPTANTWTVVTPMKTARTKAVATLLASGKVLVTGGYKNTLSSANAQSSTEIYDVAANVWVDGPAMNDKRAGHAAYLMSNGNVVILGGYTASNAASKKTDIFTPSGNSGTIAASGAMASTRADFGSVYLTASESPTGSEAILAIGGTDGAGNYRTGTELFDGSTWTAKTSLSTARSAFGIQKLADGTVLVLGGDTTSSATLNDTLIYDPKASSGAGTWTPKAAMVMYNGKMSTAKFPNGKVLWMYGDGSTWGGDVIDMHVYNPANNTWQNGGVRPAFMSCDGAMGQFTSLNDGRVLGLGCRSQGAANGEAPYAYIYDPVAASLKYTADMNEHREYPGLVTLNDGRAMAMGGQYNGFSYRRNTTEIYDPTADTWTLKATMPMFVKQAATTTLSGNRVMWAGGFGGSAFNSVSVLNTTAIYDVAANTWSSPVGARLPQTLTGHALVKTPAGRIFVLGGWNGSAVVKTVYEWNDGTTAWDTRTSMTTARQWVGAAYYPGGTDGKIIAIGGQLDNNTSGSNATGAVEIYDIGTDTWSAGATLPSSATLFGASPVYVPGLSEVDFIAPAFVGNTALAGQLLRYNIAGGTWSTLASAVGPFANGEAGLLPDGRFFSFLSGQQGAPIWILNLATSVHYVASRGDGNYAFSITAGTGTLDGRNTFVPAVPLTSGSSTIHVADGSGQTADATATIP